MEAKRQRTSSSEKSLDILARLKSGETIIGDGGFVFALEKRGWVKAGPWTPEAVFECTDAVKQLHREFVNAGSDVCQTFTFYASDDKLSNRGNKAGERWTCKGINEKACEIARDMANEGAGVMVAGGICQTPTFLSGGTKESCKKVFQEQLEVFKNKGVDFMIAEYFEHVEEAEWAVQACFEAGFKTVAVNMCIGPLGDLHGNSTEECARRLSETGAQIVGVNCHFDPFVSLEAMKMVKAGIAKTEKRLNEDVFMMVQPLGYFTPDAGKQGFIDLPEFPFALEPRVLTRWDMARFAREAHDLGVRFIGGCCGFEPYHIRACAEELSEERGCRPSDNTRFDSKWIPHAGGLTMHTKPWVRARASKEYWCALDPASGRCKCPAHSKPDGWGVTAGDTELMQQKAATDNAEIQKLQETQQQKKGEEAM